MKIGRLQCLGRLNQILNQPHIVLILFKPFSNSSCVFSREYRPHLL